MRDQIEVSKQEVISPGGASGGRSRGARPSVEHSSACCDDPMPLFFFLNVSDFIRVEQCAATIMRTLRVWERHEVLGNVYFTGLAAQALAETYPEVIRAVKEHGVAVGHHGANRPPHPTPMERVRDLPWEEAVAAALAYESHKLDPLSGEVDPSQLGGYQAMAEIFGQPPISTGRFFHAPILYAVRELGARMCVGLRENIGAPTNKAWYMGMLNRPDSEVFLHPNYLILEGRGRSQRPDSRSGIEAWRQARLAWRQIRQGGCRPEQALEHLHWLEVLAAQAPLHGVDRKAIFPEGRAQVLEERLDQDPAEVCRAIETAFTHLVEVLGDGTLIESLAHRLAKWKPEGLELVTAGAHEHDFYSEEPWSWCYEQGNPSQLYAAHLRPRAVQERIWETYERALEFLQSQPGAQEFTLTDLADRVIDERAGTVDPEALQEIARQVVAEGDENGCPPAWLVLPGDGALSLADAFQVVVRALARSPGMYPYINLLGPTGEGDCPRGQARRVPFGAVIQAARSVELGLDDRIPNEVPIDGSVVNPAEFLYLASRVIQAEGEGAQTECDSPPVNILPAQVQNMTCADVLTKLQFWTYKPADFHDRPGVRCI